LGPFQINLQYCWPTPQARSQYVVHFRDDAGMNPIVDGDMLAMPSRAACIA